ncbi:5-amino-6-(5-phospho-D-ribitylamino)uracil phosphatase YigB [Sinobacterium norvegicum]|uniref:5-amino-6-(5-phospho-D-ribitylamino)uracil phosphatase YigB n=1 Tax=Sinobacterium norvegicum TaxID=1641715 RepID=A0ABM9AF11_9GAMM|nr:HAD family hydrolase [Sinobacterium norvegicum]CAH0991797.1 5-amino-6-(5-phospho-D-ribitylamino)uracil phosphatase YigB [Sinobacterium norvegicum]
MNDHSPIEVISFDLDDTLWPLRATLEHAELDYFRWLTEQCSALADHHSLQSMREYRQHFLQQQPGLRHQISQLRIESTQQLLTDLGCHDAQAISQQGFDRFIINRNKITPYPESSAVLSELARHYRLIAITNGNADVTQSGLATFFEFCLSAEQLNASKPMAEPFLTAQQLGGFGPHQVIHVGDHLHHDIAGAQQQGWQGIWLDHNLGLERDDSITPDAIIHHIGQLPQAVSTLANKLRHD